MKHTTVKKRSRGRPSAAFSVHTRERLLAAAATHFANRSYSDVSMAAIAAEAEVTDAAIYNYFSSKDELFQETLMAVLKKYTGFFRDAAAQGHSWKEQMTNILEVYRHDAGGVTRIPYLALVAQNVVMHKREKYAAVMECFVELNCVFQSIAADAIASGDMPASLDSEALGDALMSIVTNGAGAAMLAKNSNEEISARLDCFISLLRLDGATPH